MTTSLANTALTPPLETHDFVVRLSEILKTDFDERLSPETKGLRNAVLGLGLVLILLASGGIVFTNEGAFAGIKFAPANKHLLAVVGILVELVLLVGYISRLRIEKLGWRVRELPKAWALRCLNDELTARQNDWLAQVTELQEQVRNRYLAGDRGDEAMKLSEELDGLSRSEEATRYRELSDLLTNYIAKVSRARQIRSILEVFPSIFGATAICWAAAVVLCGY